jgi:hypothetical protein
MNFQAAQETLFRDLGLQSSSERTAWHVQEVRDALNWSIDRIMTRAVYWYSFVRTGSITIVNGTSSYELGDDCIMPISFWRQGEEPDKIFFISPEEVDRLGFRSTSAYSAQGRAEQYTSMQGRFTASKTVVCSTISGTTCTRSSGDSFASTDVGKRVRINGESPDYYITAIVEEPNACTLDRGYVARASGEDAFAEVTTASSATVEVSPGPVRKIEVVPTPATADTAYYRYARRWKYLLANTDVPDAIEEQWHWVWIAGAKLQIKAFLEKPELYALYKAEFEQGVAEMKSRNMPAMDGPQARYEAAFEQNRWPHGGGVDLASYRRGNGYG